MGRVRRTCWRVRVARDVTVRLLYCILSIAIADIRCHIRCRAPPTHSYLQNGNILAARTFIVHFVSQMTSRRSSLLSSHQPTPIPVGKPVDGEQDEITFTTDSAVNFAQLAVRTCQRAQGEKNKALREAWVRLCGTYQSRGGDVANKEVRKVSDFGLPSRVSSHPSAP